MLFLKKKASALIAFTHDEWEQKLKGFSNVSLSFTPTSLVILRQFERFGAYWNAGEIGQKDE